MNQTIERLYWTVKDLDFLPKNEDTYKVGWALPTKSFKILLRGCSL